MTTSYTLTGDFNDLLGEEPRITGAWLETNLPAGTALVDLDANKVLLSGPKRITLDASNVFSISLIATNSTGTNVTDGTLRYRVRAQYSDGTGVPRTWESGFFDLTAAADLSDKVGGAGDLDVTIAPSASLIDAPTAANVTGPSQTRTALDAAYARRSRLAFLVGDYASPQAAIDAAQASGAAAVVKFGRGNFAVAAALTVTASDILLDLGDAKLTSTTGEATIRFTGTSGSRLSRVGVRGGYIDLGTSAVSGVAFAYCNDPTIDGLRVNGGTVGAAGAAVSMDNCSGALVRGVRAHGTETGIALSATTDSTITGGIFTQVGRDGVTVYSGSDRSTVTGCTVKGYNTGGSAGRAGIHAYGSTKVTVSGNIVDSAGVATADDSPKIRFRDCRDFACTGNYVSGLGAGGITVIALADIGSGAGLGTISGNTIRDVSITGIGVHTSGAATTSSLYPVTISGNFIKGVRTLGVNEGAGIDVRAGADAAAVVGNYIEDTDGSGINSATNGTLSANVVRQVGKGAIGAKVGIYITAGTCVVAGNHVYDDSGAPTLTSGLRVATGATARTAGNLWQNATSADVRNDGTIESQVGDINTAKVGFFGTAPITRPSGTPAAATDAATTQTLVNDLRTKLLALGLIAP